MSFIKKVSILLSKIVGLASGISKDVMIINLNGLLMTKVIVSIVVKGWKFFAVGENCRRL